MEEFEKLASSPTLDRALKMAADYYMCPLEVVTAEEKEKGVYSIYKRGKLMEDNQIRVKRGRYIFGWVNLKKQ